MFMHKFVKLYGKNREAKPVESLAALAFLTSSMHYYLVTVHNENIVSNVLVNPIQTGGAFEALPNFIVEYLQNR